MGIWATHEQKNIKRNYVGLISKTETGKSDST